MYDLIIRNGTVVDGTRAKAYKADVSIKDGKIAEIAAHIEAEAVKEIDAAGKVVSPGFIDIHCHSDLAPLAPFKTESMLYQGVTFELCGNCGISVLPSTDETRASISEYFIKNLQYPTQGIEIDFNTTDEYAAAAAKNGHSINYGMLVGHGVLRGCVMGFDNRNPNAEELEAMKKRLDEELSMGAFGMSLGLIYPPSAFAEAEEIEELARVVAKHDGILSVHIRNEGPRVFESAKEMLDIAEHSGVHLEISHLKIMTKSLWHQSQKLLDMIDEYRARGVNVTCDQYPFSASSTSMTALVPKWAHSGGIPALQARINNPEQKLKDDIATEMESRGGAESVMIASTKGLHGEWEGLRLSEIAAELGMDPVDAVIHILKVCECAVNCNYFSQNEEDMQRIISRVDIAVGSDGYDFPYDSSILTDKTPHPRSFATFPRALQILRENNLLPLEDAVYKMTGCPAQIMGMKDRGVLAAGKVADITIFDADTVGMSGDFLNPIQRPAGIDTVLVAGQVVMTGGEVIESVKPGTILRHGKC